MGNEAPPASPEIPGLEPVFRHLDDPDMSWQQVKRIRNADGSESSVWEKWLSFSPDPQYLSLYAKYDPGMMVRRHGHYSPHVLFVIEGEIWCGDRRCPAGTHIELPFGAAFGPFRAGPEGCTLFEVMMGDPRSWGDDPEAFTALMEEHGASGRSFAGRIVQLVTGSTGLDDFEWGVTLFADHVDDLKAVVYTLRFDEASALYGEFGTFYTGVCGDVDDVLAELGA